MQQILRPVSYQVFVLEGEDHYLYLQDGKYYFASTQVMVVYDDGVELVNYNIGGN